MSEPFGDIPLFREIQRLLESSKGPINYEIARQVAGAVVQAAGRGDIPPEYARVVADAATEAQPLVSGFTRIEPAEPVTVAVIDRAQWMVNTLEGWGWMLERFAERFGVAETRPDDPAAAENPFQLAMAQMAPLLVGVQAGSLVGNLAARAVATYDPPLPRSDDRPLFLVGPNVHTIRGDYQLDAGFLRWLAFREVIAHLVVETTPWLANYWRNLVLEVIDAIEIDTAELERRLMDMQAGSLADAAMLGDPNSVLPIVPSDRHRRAHDRLKAFEALFEGYRATALEAISGQVIGDASRYVEGLSRWRANAGEGEALLGTVLGLLPDRSVPTAGSTFCAAVTKLHGIAALNQVWAAPDNLPSAEEIKDPFAWMERVLED